MKIGLVGEHTSDCKVVALLLKQRYTDDTVSFIEILTHINGANLDDATDSKILHRLRREFEWEELDFLIYIRDLDALISNRIQLKKRKQRFARLNKTIDKKGIFLLNIYELESLFLADFESLKNFFHAEDWNFDPKSASETINAKEVLHTFTPSYNVLKLTKSLNINTIVKNHRFFGSFIVNLEKMIQHKKFNAAPYFE